ncbi:helix-turn-helix transcriptional regulator [uncultured Thiodictyon sp.]|uniref:helix-turn-helix domain-containing protein n=1 Tax=uncultured Thiodictyon sp. TaxID=1846217 RepID=UPI0025E1CF37|nr:helix-turn-helix transcriptional regulator [uncultured Thiodictyon sp.]
MTNREKLRQIGGNLRSARRQARLTQSQLAQQCGIVQSDVGQIERAEKNVTLDTLLTLCAALGIEIIDLMQMEPANDSESATDGLQA